MTKKPKLIALCNALGGGKKNVPIQETTAKKFYDDMSIDVLARTLWGEARGEGNTGMHAVANVIMNRVAHAEKKGGFWWGNNIIQVCQKPYQFSCWNRSDANFKKLAAVDEGDMYFATAVRIARRAMAGVLDDVTGAATHYHADSITPYWVKGETSTTTIGRHIFYRLVD